MSTSSSVCAQPETTPASSAGKERTCNVPIATLLWPTCHRFSAFPADRVELGDGVAGQGQVRCADVIAEVGDGGSSRYERGCGRALQQPGQGNLMRRRAEVSGHGGERRGLKPGEAAEREERGVGDVLGRAPVDECIVGPVGDVVHVLDGNDRGDGLRLGELSRGCGAEAEVADQAFLAHGRQGAELVGDRLVAGTVFGQAEVDDVEDLEAEVLEVLKHLGSQVRRFERWVPAAVWAAPGADLGDDAQVRRIRVQRFPDEFVDYAGPVEVTGVDVRDAKVDGFAQNSQRLVAIPGRPEYSGTR